MVMAVAESESSELKRLQTFIDENFMKQLDGAPSAQSQFGETYRAYKFGSPAIEGVETPYPVRQRDLRMQVDHAIAIFQSAVGSDQRVLVWRRRPEVDRDSSSGAVRLYFRCHFMTLKEWRDHANKHGELIHGSGGGNSPDANKLTALDLKPGVTTTIDVGVVKGPVMVTGTSEIVGDFSWALVQIKRGNKVSRRGWDNFDGNWLEGTFRNDNGRPVITGLNHPMALLTVDDLLAIDWQIVGVDTTSDTKPIKE